MVLIIYLKPATSYFLRESADILASYFYKVISSLVKDFLHISQKFLRELTTYQTELKHLIANSTTYFKSFPRLSLWNICKFKAFSASQSKRLEI